MKKIFYIMILLQFLQCKPVPDVENSEEKPIVASNELQSEDKEFITTNDKYLFCIKASPYLNVRDKPSVESEVTAKLKFNTTVIIVKRKNLIEEINGKIGNWVEIQFENDKTGWVFDAFLKEKENTVKLELEKLYTEFKSIEYEKNIDKFMNIHKKVGFFLNNFQDYSDIKDDWDHGKYYEDRWEEFGVTIFKHEFTFGSYNRLLNIIHDINPHSKYREHTLYAELIRTDGEFCVVPNIKEGLEYIEEFPNGKYLPEVYLTLAQIYTDLYTLTTELAPDIFEQNEQYARYNDKSPIPVQMKKNKKLALYYLKKYRALKPDKETSHFDELLAAKKSYRFFYMTM